MESMLRGIKDVQFYLMSVPKGDHKLKMHLIEYALDKLQKTGLYSRAIQKWECYFRGSMCVWGQPQENTVKATDAKL